MLFVGVGSGIVVNVGGCSGYWCGWWSWWSWLVLVVLVLLLMVSLLCLFLSAYRAIYSSIVCKRVNIHCLHCLTVNNNNTLHITHIHSTPTIHVSHRIALCRALMYCNVI